MNTNDDVLDVQHFAMAETYKWIDKANSLYSLNIAYPTVSFKLKGRFAGRAFGRDHLIKYNYRLLMENFTEFVTKTIPHETAHIVEFHMFGKMGHKANWKKIMNSFGIANPKRCHNYKTYSTRKRLTFN
jgi:SprT protein